MRADLASLCHVPHRTTTDRVLLLDTFFNVVVFLGDNINKWVQVRRLVFAFADGHLPLHFTL